MFRTIIIVSDGDKPIKNYLNTQDFQVLASTERDDVFTFLPKGQVGQAKTISEMTIEKLNEGK